MTRADYTEENLNEEIGQHANVVRAHDAVHRDRSECGGVGGCLLMATELDAMRAIEGRLEHAARRGLTLTVAVGS